CVFFCSSRRRHTRLVSDWSSDVCSSDLGLYAFRQATEGGRFPLALISPATSRTISSTLGELHRKLVALELHPDDAAPRGLAEGEIGRASCRERAEGSGGAVGLAQRDGRR